MTILYIGNKLSEHGNSPTGIEFLGPLLEEKYRIIYSSEVKNKILRLLDMIIVLINHRKELSIVLIDTYSSLNFYYAFIISQLCRFFMIKYIPILRGGNLPERLTKTSWMSNLIFNHSFVNVSPSKFMKDVFNLNNHRSEYIANFLVLRNYSFKLRKNIKPRLLFVRSFHKLYNPLMAIYVLHKLLRDYPDATLCMVGPDKDGTLNEANLLVQQLNLSEKVYLMGKLSKKEWVTMSQGYDVFINTTNHDNIPISVMEAMALGLPVISTNVGGIPYLIQENKNGLLVEKNDVAAMVNKIKCLIENKELTASISKQARKTVEKYDWEVIKTYWFNILEGNVIQKNS